MLLARFNPISEKASNTAVLDFEKPLVELDHKIREVRVWGGAGHWKAGIAGRGVGFGSRGRAGWEGPQLACGCMCRCHEIIAPPPCYARRLAGAQGG